MKYPRILDEEATLELCFSKSITRFGDGEWRCAIGGGCTSQRPDARLALELQHILAKPRACVVALPNALGRTPKRESWEKYTQEKFIRYARQPEYGSSFITRPDNAPWIDTPEYWAKVRQLWWRRNICLVVGDKKSITSEMIQATGASGEVREVHGPRQHAYAEIERLEDEVGITSELVILCLGTTATVLAYRLAQKGMHALDLGHIGMFMRHAGAYKYTTPDLISDGYREQIQKLHQARTWGADGKKHVPAVTRFAIDLDAKTILDYGCGENKLAEGMAPIRVSGYDPGIPERAGMPKPCDFVVCTDVLEHIEPEKLDGVLDHIWRLTGKGAYFVISTKPANAILPDGRNAHICLLSREAWLAKITSAGFKVEALKETGKDFELWVRK